MARSHFPFNFPFFLFRCTPRAPTWGYFHLSSAFQWNFARLGPMTYRCITQDCFGACMLVCGQIFSFFFFRTKKAPLFSDQIGIRRGMRTDVEGEPAVGKISRTAAGRAALLTIVWQEFRFQLCATTLLSSSPSSPLASLLSLSLPACLHHEFVPLSLLQVPSLPFAKTTTYARSRTGVSL